MTAPRYTGYKDSGVAWLGHVPSHWHISPFKWEVDRNDGGVWGDDPDGADDTIVLRSTEQTVFGHWRMDDPAPRKLSKTERAAALLAEGDLVVTKSSGSSLHIGKTTIVTAEIAAAGCCYSNFMQRIRTRSTFLPKLAWYVMNNDLARLQFDLASNSTTGLANLNGTMIGGIVVAVPPVGEQVSIVTFLDRETAKIDALVEEQRRLIELLKEKRQAVISQAVTKGLNPKVPLKDSGVEWLGKVPAHWECRTIAKASTKITNGFVGPTRDILVDAGVPYVQATHIKSGKILFDGAYFVTSAWSDIHKKSILREGDVLIVQTGAGTGDIGLVSLAEVGYNCHALIIVSPNSSRLVGEYLSAVLQSAYGRATLTSIQTGAMHPHLNCGEVKFVLIPLPPPEEQRRIVEDLARVKVGFDKLMVEATNAISLLQERRGALISAAVTGKIDVRGLVPQLEAVAA